ncbi:MAG: hypothetical protein ACXW18_04815, partial [Pyrinomonadaceae bacterium]
MKHLFTLQRVAVSRFSVSLLVFLLMVHVLCGQTSSDAHRKTAQKENASTADLTQRIERVESGLLPPAVLKGEPPVRMRLADRMQFYKTP